MKFAISTDNGAVSEHFGRCPEFTLIAIDNGKLINKETIQNPGHHPGFLPKFLRDRGVSGIIAGGMGQRAQALFDEVGIQTILGVSGNIEEIIRALIEGKLKGGQSLCSPGAGKGYGVEKTECDHPHEKETT